MLSKTKDICTIDDFTKIRRILYSTFHKGDQGQTNAFEYLERYRRTMRPQSYMGFYQKYRKEFTLSVGADVGDRTDFSGQLGE